MGKKKYTTEIIDTFSGEIQAKEALKIAKKIKGAQEKSYPSKEFKQRLYSRLSNAYLIAEMEDVQPKFSIFQLFAAFASFVFISGTILTVFYSRDEGQQMFYIEEALDDAIVSEVPVNTQQGSQNIDEFQSDVSQDIVVPEVVEQKQEIDTIIQPENFIQEVSEKKNLGDDFPEPIGESTESLESFDPIVNPAASSIFIESSSENREEQEASFIEICREYGGNIGEDDQECILADGKICREENIHECATDFEDNVDTEDTEIDLEELIQEFGQ